MSQVPTQSEDGYGFLVDGDKPYLEVADAVVDGERGQVRAGEVDGARWVVVLHQPADGRHRCKACKDPVLGSGCQKAAV